LTARAPLPSAASIARSPHPHTNENHDMSNDPNQPSDKRPTPQGAAGIARREFLAKTVFGAGAGLVATSVAACGAPAGDGAGKGGKPEGGGDGTPPPTPTPDAGGHAIKTHVPPGQLDEYYGFWSGGQSGEIRVLGIPSMREIKRIPVFNRDSATGWGQDDWSKKLLSGMSSGDTHHVHLSYTDGTYDGRYVFVNDKAGGRLARVRLDTFEVDSIVDLPNCAGTHGIFPQRHKTGYVVCNSEFHHPMPNDGRDMDDPKKWGAMHTAVDGETMEVKWQVLVEGNMDLAATDYKGLYSFATCYNSEQELDLEGMMKAERDYLYVFNIKNIEQAVADGKTITVGDSKVPVVDARATSGDPFTEKSPYVLRIPVPKSPHGVNIDPTGKYAVASGKLSPTATVVDIDKIADAFEGKIEPKDCIVAEPELGLGPLHTAFDGKGNAYTSIFIDSVVTKWNIEKAIKLYAGDKTQDPIIQKLDVSYQIGHINASMSETKEADGKWLIALCKFSKDRFLSVGLLHPENDQLIDISGEKMEILHDGPTYPEPHDAVMLRTDLLKPVKISPRTGANYDYYNEMAKEDGVDLLKDNKVVRKGNLVRVYMTSMAPNFGMREFRVKKGDTVQVIVTNQDQVEDVTHGFCVSRHDVCMVVNVNGTNSVTFTADKAGVHWYYCPWFCHALHLEMRGRMYVEA
jgi:nitrous-oxide reductase